jgi:hypothetical protein
MGRHLKDLLRDSDRSDSLFFENEGIIADFSRQRVTDKTLKVGNLYVGSLSGCQPAEFDVETAFLTKYGNALYSKEGTSINIISAIDCLCLVFKVFDIIRNLHLHLNTQVPHSPFSDLISRILILAH